MIQMSLTLVVDTFAWIEYFAGNPAYKDAVEKSTLITPSVVGAEITRAFIRKGIPDKTIQKQLAIIKNMSLVADLEFEHAEAGGKLAETHGLHFSDALIYSFASKDRLFLTGDRHFERLPHVKFIK